MKTLAALAFALASTAALAQADGGWRDPTPALQKRVIYVETVSGLNPVMVEVAATEEARNVGMAGRRVIPQGTGMLYDFGADRDVGMWMKGNLVPLDMVFVREDGQVADVRDNAVPGDLTPIQSPIPVRYVIEMPAGAAARIEVKRTDRIRFEAPPAPPAPVPDDAGEDGPGRP